MEASMLCVHHQDHQTQNRASATTTKNDYFHDEPKDVKLLACQQFASIETPTLGHPYAKKKRNPESQNQKPLSRNCLPPCETELATRREKESPLPVKTASEREKKEGKKRVVAFLELLPCILIRKVLFALHYEFLKLEKEAEVPELVPLGLAEVVGNGEVLKKCEKDKEVNVNGGESTERRGERRRRIDATWTVMSQTEDEVEAFSMNKDRTHRSSLVVSAKALYSASVEERATERCFQELQEMRRSNCRDETFAARARQIMEHPFEGRPMRHSRMLHELRKFVGVEGDVRETPADKGVDVDFVLAMLDLWSGSSCSGRNYFNAQEIVKITKVFQGKSSSKGGNKMKRDTSAVELTKPRESKNTRSFVYQARVHFEAANMIRETFVDKTRGLEHENFLFECPLKKCIVDIKLTNGPSLTNCKCEDNANGDRFNNRTECLYAVPTRELVKPLATSRALYRSIEPSEKDAQVYGAMKQRSLCGQSGPTKIWLARDRVHPHMSHYELFDLIFCCMEETHKVWKRDKSLSKSVPELVMFKPESLPINNDARLARSLVTVSRRGTRRHRDTGVLLLEGVTLRQDMALDIAPLTATKKRFAIARALSWEKEPVVEQQQRRVLEGEASRGGHKKECSITVVEATQDMVSHVFNGERKPSEARRFVVCFRECMCAGEESIDHVMSLFETPRMPLQGREWFNKQDTELEVQRWKGSMWIFEKIIAIKKSFNLKFPGLLMDEELSLAMEGKKKRRNDVLC
ncbi:hypothetical protein V8G54_001961 [Vigna mungo]|uniref:Uncharacterized protein n=1 Tax=Vigna mungo TaxID=3915 RepID=A0AAQ3SAD2_VIGMU